MLYYISKWFQSSWGPLRLFQSHVFLLALGTALAALIVWWLLPRWWRVLPHDHGKAILGKDGMKSEGKPTGAGFLLTLMVLPVILLTMPFKSYELGVLLFLCFAMVFGYLDDRAVAPWGQVKKFIWDVVVCAGVAMFIYWTHGGEVWMPFVKGTWVWPWYVYVPIATFLLLIILNTTNCSDGVDALAGTLTLISLVSLAGFLYVVVGYAPAANYLLIPTNASAARWSIMLMTVAGGLAGYLWWNCEPSRVLMGDAGSRFLGLLVGAGALMTGNPLIVIVFAPVVLVNGGMGLAKLIVLRFCRLAFKWDVRPPAQLTELEQAAQHPLVKFLYSFRCPLHDNCKRHYQWSNAQVLMRFVLLQAFLIPLLFVLLVKVR